MVVRKQKKKHRFRKFIFSFLFVGFVLLSIKVWQVYKTVEEPNVNLSGKSSQYICIPTGANYKDVTNILYSENLIINRNSFEWMVEKKKYAASIKPGRYKITKGMSNNALINLLRSGKQEPVRVVFNKVRTKDRFAGVIHQQIEADSAELVHLLMNNQFLKEYNKTSETAMCLFIPNTYEFYWNTDAKQFISRMDKEYQRFWSSKRLSKAKNTGLTPDEVMILASIIEEESTKDDEKPALAGVYINRLKKKMRLQADPTVRFAIGDFEIKRILNDQLNVDSPYNTYKFAGLPPGPICIPSISSIDAVLNFEKHNYLYFCAKDDFSGYHVFAKTLEQHNQNAAKYRKTLNRNRIYR